MFDIDHFIKVGDLYGIFVATHIVPGEKCPITHDVLAIDVHDSAGHVERTESVHVAAERPGARFRLGSSWVNIIDRGVYYCCCLLLPSHQNTGVAKNFVLRTVLRKNTLIGRRLR